MRFQGITISKKMGILLLIILSTSCSTNKVLKNKIIKSLKVQNSLILKIEKQRQENFAIKGQGKESKLRESERSLLIALESIRNSNKAVIKKLINISKKEKYETKKQ